MKKICFFCFFALLIFADDIRVDLKNPTFSQKTMHTDDGGLIQSNNFWLQSQTIKYTRDLDPQSETNFVEAEGDFRLDYFDQVFIGDRLEYDFIQKRGIIHNGKTQSGFFYISGSRIILEPDGTYTIENAVLTTCENRQSEWRLRAHRLTIENKQFITAKDVSFRVVKVPVFWLPRLKATLNSLRYSPIELELGIKEKGGPRLTAKYLVYAWEYSRTYLRLDYRLKAGFGAGIESFYKNPHNNTKFMARNYVARDVRIDDPERQTRYRIEGVFNHTSQDLKHTLDFSYDKVSDIEMPSDYPTEAFNEQNSKPTQLLATNRQKMGLVALFSNVRVNSFQTLKQELPTFLIKPYPIQLFEKGPIFTMPIQLSYLKYQYAKEWQPILPSFSSARFFLNPELTHSFNLSVFRISPKIGAVVLGYSDSFRDKEQLYALGMLSAQVDIPFYKLFNHYLHQMEPYARVTQFTRSTTSLEDHYVFDLKDGYTEMGLCTIGIRNTFFRPMHTLTFNLFTNTFWDARAFSKAFPLIGLAMHWQLPKLHLESEILYNLEHNSLNHFIFHTKWTIGKNLAMILEFRHRGQYDFKKVDKSRYFLEAARSLNNLIDSGLSDANDTILTNIYYRFSPLWTLKFESRHGFGRIQSPRFNDFRIELERFLSCNLKLKFTVQHTHAVNFKAMASLTLDKKPMRPKFHIKDFRPSF